MTKLQLVPFSDSSLLFLGRINSGTGALVNSGNRSAGWPRVLESEPGPGRGRGKPEAEGSAVEVLSNLKASLDIHAEPRCIALS